MQKVLKRVTEINELILYQLVAVVSSIAVIAVCASVIAARYIWHVEVKDISQWLGPIGMSTNTALCLMLLALGQILHIFGSLKRRSQYNAT